jgi:hypothetical protein
MVRTGFSAGMTSGMIAGKRCYLSAWNLLKSFYGMTMVSPTTLDCSTKVGMSCLEPARPYLITRRICHIMDGEPYCHSLLVLIKIAIQK